MCRITGCEKDMYVLGLCRMHYERKRRHGDPEFTLISPKGAQAGMTCIIQQCRSPAKYKGLCKKHYKRQWRHGDPLKTLINMDRLPEPCKVDGCLENARYPVTGMCHKHHVRWIRYGRTERVNAKNGAGGLNRDGYRVFRVDGKFIYEHIQVAEKAYGGSLPPGAVVHHVDRNKTNNTPTNLVICPNQAYHMLLHKRHNQMDTLGYCLPEPGVVQR